MFLNPLLAKVFKEAELLCPSIFLCTLLLIVLATKRPAIGLAMASVLMIEEGLALIGLLFPTVTQMVGGDANRVIVLCRQWHLLSSDLL